MSERPLEPWMTNAAGPFVTINAGGPLRGVVTISVATNGGAHLLAVKSMWKARDGEPQSTSQTVDSYDAARRLAHAWADLLAIGREPDPM